MFVISEIGTRLTVDNTTAQPLPNFPGPLLLMPDPANSGHIYIRMRGSASDAEMAIPQGGLVLSIAQSASNFELIASAATQYLGIAKLI